MKVKTNRKVTLIGKNGSAQATLVDLSLDGAGILSPRGARVGTELELIFEIPTSEYFRTLNILATVTHRHHTDEGNYMEMRFDDLENRQEQYIREFIDYKNRLLSLGQKTSVSSSSF